jgi:large subunit ribosomal protein L9
MKVILREDVKSLGQAGAVVNVADGYARNYLLPRRVAVAATDTNLKTAAVEQRKYQARHEEALAGAEAQAQRIREMTVTIEVQTGGGEKLFGAVTAKDIAEALGRDGITVDRRMIELEAPIKQVGDVTVQVRLHPSVDVPLQVKVIPESVEPAAKKTRRKTKTT